MILGYRLQDYLSCGVKIPITIELPMKTSNVLIAGKSGSGKSLSGLWYVFQLLSEGNNLVWICDYKGGIEYCQLEGSHCYASGNAAVQMIRDYYKLFSIIREHRVRMKAHITLYIEEWFGLLGYLESYSKKDKSEIMSMVGEILAVGRGLNAGIILCTQRCDSSNFSAGAREQFHCAISFGRCSAEQFRMLGFSGELEENPTQHFSAGKALAIIDGQGSVEQLIVPYIKNAKAMMLQVRRYLDNQIEISVLIQEIAAGNGLNL